MAAIATIWTVRRRRAAAVILSLGLGLAFGRRSVTRQAAAPDETARDEDGNGFKHVA